MSTGPAQCCISIFLPPNCDTAFVTAPTHPETVTSTGQLASQWILNDTDPSTSLHEVDGPALRLTIPGA